MKKTYSCLFAFMLLAGAAMAQTAETAKPAKDHSTKPDLYFLYEGDVANSLELLPPPPGVESIAFLNDKARYEWGKSLRNTPRGDQAFQDARVDTDHLPNAFSEAFGTEISKDATPEIFTLMIGMREDAGDLATRDAKDYYNRVRPFAYFGEDTCNPEQQEELSTNGSYPSGHTSIGWAIALVLAEINPDRIDEILDRGYEMGESRVICGYHFQSDVDAGRIVAAGAVSRLHADDGFNKQLGKAKAEFAKLQKEGKVKPGKKSHRK